MSAKARLREKERVKREQRAVLDVMKSVSGRHFAWMLLSFCGIYQTSAGQTEIARSEGKRDVGLYLLGLVGDADDELLFKMMRENKMRAEAETRQLDAEMIEEQIGKHESGKTTTFVDQLI